MNVSKEDPSADSGVSPEAHTRTQTALVNLTGVFGSIFGMIFVVAKFPTFWPKVIGLMACISVTGLAWQAARDRDRGKLSNRLLAWLLGTGSVILVLVMSITAQIRESPSSGPTDKAGGSAQSSSTAERNQTSAEDSSITQPAQPPAAQTTDTSTDPLAPIYSDKVMKFAPPGCGFSGSSSWSIDFDIPAVNGEGGDLQYDCEDYGLIESWDAKSFGDAPSGSATAENCQDAAQATGRASVNVSEVVAKKTGWCVVTHSGQVAWVRITGKGAPFSEYGELPTLTLLVTLWPAL